jgi:hypothetical protein
MPKHHPYVFRIPTALSWADAHARVLSRADGPRKGDALDVRFFVDAHLQSSALSMRLRAMPRWRLP